MRRLAWGALLCAPLACAPPPVRLSKRFPIGLFSVERPGDLAAIRRAGFDWVQSYAAEPEKLAALASEARRQELNLLVAPYLLRASSTNVRDWPLGAWYINDEPDVHRLAPSALGALSKDIAAWDPRPQAFVIGRGLAARDYGAVANALMVDWYPVPHLSLDSVAQQLDDARRYLPEGKPLWMVVQAFDWRDFPQRDPKKPRIGRFPDHHEIRFMSYLSILHGATGLFYFLFQKPDGSTLLDTPEHWQALSRVVGEIRTLKPILEKGHREALPASLHDLGIEGIRLLRRGRRYVILLNRRADMLAPLPEEFLDKSWRPLFEVRRDIADLVQEVGGICYLRPRQVLVLER